MHALEAPVLLKGCCTIGFLVHICAWLQVVQMHLQAACTKGSA